MDAFLERIELCDDEDAGSRGVLHARARRFDCVKMDDDRKENGRHDGEGESQRFSL